MTLKQAKQFVKENGVYAGISYITEGHAQEDTDALKEIIYRFLDNLSEDVYYRAVRKATK